MRIAILGVLLALAGCSFEAVSVEGCGVNPDGGTVYGITTDAGIPYCPGPDAGDGG